MRFRNLGAVHSNSWLEGFPMKASSLYAGCPVPRFTLGERHGNHLDDITRDSIHKAERINTKKNLLVLSMYDGHVSGSSATFSTACSSSATNPAAASELR
jgi:hypothetical protein